MPISLPFPTTWGADPRINTPRRLMVGAVTESSATIVFDSQNNATAVTLKVATNAGLSNNVQVLSFDGQNVPGGFCRSGKKTFSGLQPSTTYYYGVDYGFGVPSSAVRSFKTPPAEGTRSDSKLAFSACCNAVSGTSWPFALNIISDEVDWWAHCGDYGYAVNPTDIHTLDEAHVQTSQRQMDSCRDIDTVHKTTPVVGMLQNHDRCWANAQWGQLSNSGILMQDIARLGGDVYQTRFPHYPIRDPSGYCLAQMFSWANVRVYLWDTMGQRHGAGGTTLGNNSTVYYFDQLSDFLDQMAADDASELYDVAILLNSSTWQNIGLQSFEQLSPDEMLTILSAVGNLENMLAIMCGGDVHQWAIDDGTYTSIQFDPSVRLPQITSSGLRQSETTDIGGPWEWRGQSLWGLNAVGEVAGKFGGNYATIGIEHEDGIFARVRLKIRATPDDGTGTANDVSGAVKTLAEVTTDEEANVISFLDAAPTAAASSVLTIDLEKSWLGAASVTYTCSHGPTGTVVFGPNRRRKSFDVSTPSSAGSFTVTLSSAVGCTIDAANPATVTVE